MSDEETVLNPTEEIQRDRHIFPTVEARVAELIRHCAVYRKLCSCGAEIYFLEHKDTQKLTPYQIDGLNHFLTCPESKKYRRRS
jgi:hypothetical protein